MKRACTKHRRRGNFLAKILVVTVVLGTIIGLYLVVAFNPILKDTVEAKSKALATRAMNSAISDVVMNSIIYDDLINIVTDEFGNISMIQANALEINNLSKDLAQTTELRLEEFGKVGMKVPLGSFSGIPILVGRGPLITVRASPVGAVHCSFSSKFEYAGINQTNHKIYLTISADVSVVMPVISQKFTADQQVLIAESIIVGQVPEVYLYSDQLDTLLNFVPY